MGEKSLPAMSDKGLIIRIYRKLKNLTSRRINNPLNNWANELNRQFSKKSTNRQWIHEDMLNILGHKGNANQNHTEIPPHPSQVAIINNTSNNRW
jgi:hypothetical protein